jgi:hypothetical protein
MTVKARKQRVEAAAIEQNGVCPICGYGNFCFECVRGKGPESPHKHEYQTLNSFDHDHNCCKKGCEKCFRGALHAFCNQRILPVWEAYFKRFGFVESLSQEDRDFLVGVNPGWAKFGYVDRFNEVRAYLKALYA